MLKNIGAVFIFLVALITSIILFSAERGLWLYLIFLGCVVVVEIIAATILLWLHWGGYYDPYPEQSTPPESVNHNFPSKRSEWVRYLFSAIGLALIVWLGNSQNTPRYILSLILSAITFNALQYLLSNLYKTIKKRLDPYRRRVLS
jgi:hypothetical protein